ncbi:hypothetical protein HAX54_043735, partial [Datura stramonium]|nr:hypothetical protein [Datura stramonium]
VSIYKQDLGESSAMAGYKSRNIRMVKRGGMGDHKCKRERCTSFCIQNGYACSNLSCLVGTKQKNFSTSKQKCGGCYATDHTGNGSSRENIPKVGESTE